jgi:hypothetical protein
VKIRAKYTVSEIERVSFKSNEKTELKQFTFVGISSTSDGKDMELYSKEQLLEKEAITKLNSSNFYVFYPVRKQMIICMGESKRSRLGGMSGADIP